jgi:lipopolysaccharide transport system ATP-binding protein
MSSESRAIAIRVERLVKDFKLYAHPFDLLREVILGGRRHRAFRALDEISFEVRQGEIIGLVGRNGAGKSTLLKIVTGVLDYDGGRVAVEGKVAAILELGSGFNPEYTGRQNVYFDAICMGMKRAEILAKMDGIIRYAELEAVIDQPFRTYSSGMRARLAFAAAISVDADILIIDEALSVGDALFQGKCFQRLREIASSGCTVFFVTHSLGQVYALCTRALLMHKGRILADGEPRKVGYEYERLLSEAGNKSPVALSYGDVSEEPAADATVVDIGFFDRYGENVRLLTHGEKYRVISKCRCRADFDALSIGFRIQKPSGEVVYGTSTFSSDIKVQGRKDTMVEVAFSFTCLLAGGQYVLGGGVAHLLGPDKFQVLHVLRDKSFEVVSHSQFQGVVDLQSTILTVKQSAP